MKKVVITGATGMIGGLVQQACLKDSTIEEVVSFVRRPSGTKHKKLTEIQITDFTNYNEHRDVWKGAEAVYFCIGVYTGAVPREKFREITVDFTKACVDVVREECPTAKFCFLSGQGADRTEKSRMMFAKDKGIAENYLFDQLEDAYTFRPGYIYPVTPRKEPNFSYRLSRKLYPLLKILMPKGVVTSEHLANAMFNVGKNGHSKTTFENVDILEVK